MEVVPPENSVREALSIKNRHEVATTLYVPLPVSIAENSPRTGSALPVCC